MPDPDESGIELRALLVAAITAQSFARLVSRHGRQGRNGNGNGKDGQLMTTATPSITIEPQ